MRISPWARTIVAQLKLEFILSNTDAVSGGSFVLGSGADAKRVTIRVSNMTLTYAPWHVSRRKRRHDTELQCVFVKCVDFSRRL
jgi:hypothetical protein